ncbi:MAG: protein BmrU [Pirellulaceae bacterium]|nr:protein BmrU [Pirellulaceae bacterium]
MNASSHVLIAANPKSGASSGRAMVGDLRNSLADRGFVAEICDSLPAVASRSHQLSQSGQLRAVVAAGGDGTAAAVVNLIPHSVPMALLPLGTENLLAKHLGVTRDVRAATEHIVAGKTRQLDAGCANGRLFLVMLGCGFDAEVVAQMHQIRRGHINRLSYAKPIWQSIRSYNYPIIDVHLENSLVETAASPTDLAKPVESLAQSENSAPLGVGQAPTALVTSFSTAWLFAFNLPRYAADLRFCPQAIGDDGLLDVCAFTQAGLWRGLGYLSQLWLGRHQQMKSFRHLAVQRFRLSSDGRVPYQVDGDPGGVLPLEVEVLPKRLTLLCT